MTDNTARRRRGHGEDAIYFDAARNRYVGAISVGFGPDGKRLRRKVTGKTKAEVRDKLKAAHAELDRGLHTSAAYTVKHAVDDWLEGGLQGRSERTRSVYCEALKPLLESAKQSRLNAYVMLSLAVGIRTEEARELHWDHVDLDGKPNAARPVPPSVAVWHSVRQGGDTKTAKSRRTLALPQAAVQALREHRKLRSRTGWRPGLCGTITAWSSLRASARPWMPPTCAVSSARSPRRPDSASTGHRAICGTPSSP